MADFLSVIIPTYNPDLKNFSRVISSLKNQDLAYALWEILVIDNNSSIDFSADIKLNWHPNAKIVTEPKQGLTYARLKGFTEAQGNIIVMIDDDNLPTTNYLSRALEIFGDNLSLGAIGGRSLPLFESTPPAWLNEFSANLALRNLGDDIIIESWENKYPAAGPIGAGMAIRKEALTSYIYKITHSQAAITDRNGKSLSSGGDNDIVIEALKSGWLTGYFPSLTIQHIIPNQRMQVAYIARLINHTNKSWILLLESHHINPWHKIPKWTVLLRKIKAWFAFKAWKNEITYIKWQGACGTLAGLAQINN